MDYQNDLININVNICDRPYRLKIKPVEEENVRKAAKIINEKVKDFQKKYAAKDKQDYLAMCALLYAVDARNNESGYVIRNEQFLNRVSELEERLDEILDI